MTKGFQWNVIAHNVIYILQVVFPDLLPHKHLFVVWLLRSVLGHVNA